MVRITLQQRPVKVVLAAGIGPASDPSEGSVFSVYTTGAKTWKPTRELHSDLNVRSVPLLSDELQALKWLAAQGTILEPSESESDALPIAPAANGREGANRTLEAGFKGQRLAINLPPEWGGVWESRPLGIGSQPMVSKTSTCATLGAGTMNRTSFSPSSAER